MMSAGFSSSNRLRRHLPVTLLASFVKRLSRLSLSSPPAAIIMVIPFVYNLLKKHPALMVMVHREAHEGDAQQGEMANQSRQRVRLLIVLWQDPFDENEPSPLLTNALSSSLWELASHRNHYLSSVSTLAKIFSEAFTKPSYAMEDFLDHSYTTVSFFHVSAVLIFPSLKTPDSCSPPRANGGSKTNLRWQWS